MNDNLPTSEQEMSPESLADVPEEASQTAEPVEAATPAVEQPATSVEPTNRHTGRKIWYGFIIFLSGLVILVCAVGAIGTWVVEQSVSDSAVELLGVVENGAGGIRNAATRVDGRLGEAQQVTIGISQSVQQVSQNITDKGLLLTLLPEEQEQRLVDLADQLRESFGAVQELVAAGLQMYQTINRMPFVSLPGPDPEQVESIQSTLDSVRSDVDEARGAIEEVRSGAAARVDRVTNAVVMLSGRLQEGRDKLAALDSQLATVQERADSLQQTIPNLLVVLAILLTLFLIYVGYTQVEVIRLYVSKWKGLGS
jgi:hypothetical protein